MNLYRYFYRNKRSETCVGIVRTKSVEDAKTIAAKYLQCDRTEVEVRAVEVNGDGFCELYYGG